ncbi:IMD [Paramuricea clavata]|uniref:IMD, partial n=1 Tax=Paramuricea clavata TaxID=317549 RepID=A0A6S7IJB1_PARCT|nr:IMD [Paramuricea clavata]
MTTPRNNRIDSSGECCSDFSDECSSDDDSHVEIQPWTTIQHQRSEPFVLTGNGSLLLDLSGHISTVWKDVGRKLEIKESIIENIDIEHGSESNREKAYQLLLTWTRQLGSEATLHELLNALAYIGRDDLAKAIAVSNRQQRSSVGSGRAIKLEMKSHAKLQKQVLRKLKQALHFYQQRLREVEDLQHRDFDEKETREMKEKLQELDKNIIQRKLDSLQRQISICSECQRYSELDQQLKIVADNLFELDKTFNKFNDTLDDLRVSYYSKVECAFRSLCYFRYVKYPSTSSSGKHTRTSSKGDEELDDDVFQDSSCQEPREHSESPTELSESRTSPKHSFTRNTLSRSSLGKLFRSSQSRSKTSTRPHAHRGQEEHTKRKLSVSIIDDDEQFQLQDFVNKFCRRYRHDRPFIYSHCCMNRDLQGSRDDLRPRPLSSIDPNTLPVPLYLSTEAILSLVTSPSHSPRGFINVASHWI